MDNIKQDVKSKRSSSSNNKSGSKSKHRHRSNSNGLVNWFAEGTFHVFTGLVVNSTSYSNQRIYGKTGDRVNGWGANNFKKREIGDPSLPFFESTVSLHDPWGDTFNTNYSLLAGYGAAAFRYKKHFYSEMDPKDDLQIVHKHLLMRMSFGNNFEIHQGIGTTSFLDNEGFEVNEGSYTSPFIVTFSPNYQLEFTPTWAQSSEEYELSINRTQSYYSLKLGYRHFHTQHSDIGGLFASISIHF